MTMQLNLNSPVKKLSTLALMACLCLMVSVPQAQGLTADQTTPQAATATAAKHKSLAKHRAAKRRAAARHRAFLKRKRALAAQQHAEQIQPVESESAKFVEPVNATAEPNASGDIEATTPVQSPATQPAAVNATARPHVANKDHVTHRAHVAHSAHTDQAAHVAHSAHLARAARANQNVTFDNPKVNLPMTLPNWILIPHNNESAIEVEEEGAPGQGYSPVLIAGTPIVSAPYYGVQTEFDGSNLLVNASTVNKDLALLQVRQNFYNALTRRGEPLPQHPIIELSGLIQGQIMHGRGFDSDLHSDINLSSAEVDIFAGLNEWVSAFLQFEYDDSFGERFRRVNNSRVTVGSAFATFGNLNANDFYFTLGQMYVPFGQYSSSLVTSSFAKKLGRTKQRAALLGYYHQQGLTTVNASWFAFRGDTDTDGAVFEVADEVNGVGGNVSIHHDGAVVDWVLGASVINNLAESDGMQSVFSIHREFQRIDRQIPAIDLRGSVKVDAHQLSAEYVAALRDFDALQDLAHNSHGAQPKALHMEYAYRLNAFARPSTVALGYDRSWEALAIGLPEQRVSAVFSISPWRSTILSLEYRYDQDYDDDDIAIIHSQNGILVEGTGHCAHSLTAQVDVYF